MPVSRSRSPSLLIPVLLMTAGCTAETKTYSQDVGGKQSVGSSGGAGSSLGGSAGAAQSSTSLGGSAAGMGIVTAGRASSGGVSASGGWAAATGGATGGGNDTGGGRHAGGATSTGGVIANSGATSLGGTMTGGVSPTGGSVAAGGAVATGGVRATGGAPATGGIAATGGAPIVCGGTETLCPGATTCTSLANDVNNCGSCGHGCGVKSACATGRCQPALIVDGLTGGQGMDVSSKGVFYTSAATIQHCTNLADCASFTTQIGAVGQASELTVTKTLTTDLVGFLGRIIVSAKYAGYHYCPTTGCGAETITGTGPSVYIGGLVGFGGDFYYAVSPNSSAANSYLSRVVGAPNGTTTPPGVTIADQVAIGSRFVVDTSYVYLKRTDATGLNPVIVACDRIKGCSSYTTLLDIEPTNMAAYDGRLYFLNGINLRSVSPLAPATVTTITGLQTAYDRDMIVDGKNIYWSTTSSIVYCSLPSCTGGTKALVSGLTSVTNLRSEGNYLYWLAPSVSSAGASAVYRIAKP